MKRFGLLVMMCLLACMGAGAVEVEIDGIKYDVNTEDRTATVIANEPKYAGEVVIPSSIMVEGVEYAVTCIGIRAFSDCAELTSIAIPPSITFIKQNAFYQTGLTSVHIEDLEAWCKMSFELSRSNPLIEAHHLYLNGQEVKDLVIPEGVSSIGVYAFVDCTSLTSVTFPTSVTSIGHGAFYGCTELHSVNFSEGITSIGAYAFCGCSALTSLTIPTSVSTIGESAFGSCTGLTSVTLPDGITSIENNVFGGCTGLTSITIPSSVTSIGSNAFIECSGLTSFTIPGGVTSIGFCAFLGCTSLIDVYCYAETVPETDKDAFGYFWSSPIESMTLHVPASAIEAYKASEPWSKFGKIVALDDQPSDYRPFIEEGKVWKVGTFGTYNPEIGGYTDAHFIDYFYFDGDTIVGGQRCKKMMCREECDINWHSYHEPQTTYVGALYENNQRVYCALPNNNDFVLLYDFATDPNTEIAYYNTVTNQQTSGFIARRTVCEDSLYHGRVTTVNVSLEPYSTQYADLPDVSVYWREGVGYNGFYNSRDLWVTGGFVQIMQCTLGDEILYNDPSLKDCVTPQDTEVKKNWLDFTHTVKTKPKAPRRGEAAVSDEETVTGEYSIKELFVNFKTLTGSYTISITDAAGQPIYNKVVQTSNVVALNTDISTYPKGSYTITVENEEEAYSAEFTISDEDGLTPAPSPVREGSIYNLNGQRLMKPQRGVNIVNGRKVVVK